MLEVVAPFDVSRRNNKSIDIRAWAIYLEQVTSVGKDFASCVPNEHIVLRFSLAGDQLNKCITYYSKGIKYLLPVTKGNGQFRARVMV